MSAGQAELLARRPAGRAVVVRHRRPARPGHPRRPRAGERAGRPGTDQVTGLLDFELPALARVQDILAALYNSTALGAPDWPRRTAAFLRGCASVRRLGPPR